MDYCSNQDWLACGDGSHRWLREPLKGRKTHSDGIAVRANCESDEIACNAGVHDDRQFAGIPKGRHGAEFTIGEKLHEIRFTGKPDVGQSQYTADFGQIHKLIGRYYGYSEARAAEVYHGFCKLIRRHSFGIRRCARCPRGWVNGMGIADLLPAEIFKPKIDD